jgi:hypothetical protein
MTHWVHDLVAGAVVIVAVTLAQVWDATVIAFAVGVAGTLLVLARWGARQIGQGVAQEIARTESIRQAIAAELDSRPLTNGWGARTLAELKDEVSQLRSEVNVLLAHDEERDTHGKRYG